MVTNGVVGPDIKNIIATLGMLPSPTQNDDIAAGEDDSLVQLRVKVQAKEMEHAAAVQDLEASKILSANTQKLVQQ